MVKKRQRRRLALRTHLGSSSPTNRRRLERQRETREAVPRHLRDGRCELRLIERRLLRARIRVHQIEILTALDRFGVPEAMFVANPVSGSRHIHNQVSSLCPKIMGALIVCEPALTKKRHAWKQAGENNHE